MMSTNKYKSSFTEMVSDLWKGFSSVAGVVLVLYAFKLLMGW